MQSPSIHNERAFRWALGLAVALQCLGMWRTAYVDGTAVGTTLFMTLGVAEGPMLAVEHGAAWTILVLGLVSFFTPRRIPLLAIGGWFALVAALSWYQGGSFGYQYSVLAHATRILGPLALAVFAWPGWDATRRLVWAENTLRIAASLTFATHGLEALEHNPVFIDYVITAFRRVHIEISESATRVLLTAIGVQDFLLAALVMTQRWRSVVGYMALWGIVTALSRIVHLGPAKWPAVLIRSANWGVPLALFLLWAKSAERDQPTE